MSGPDTKAGARHSASDMKMLQTMHDHSVALGAACGSGKGIVLPTLTSRKSWDAMGYEERAMAVREAFWRATAADGGELPPDCCIVSVYDGVAILRDGINTYQASYSVVGDDVELAAREAWQPVEQTWTPLKSALVAPVDTLVAFGSAVKALGDGRVGGYLVSFGTKAQRDLTGEWFEPDTYFGPRDGDGVDTMFDHGYPVAKGLEGLADRLFAPLKTKKDEFGIWAETVLNLADRYEAMVYDMAEKGKLGWSSGSSAHMIKRAPDGKITRWPIIEGSLTPTPAEPRNRVLPLKSYIALPQEQPQAAGEAAERSAQEQPIIIITHGGTRQ